MGVSLKLECHSNRKFTQIETLLKLECHSSWNVTQIGTSLKKCSLLPISLFQKSMQTRPDQTRPNDQDDQDDQEDQDDQDY